MRIERLLTNKLVTSSPRYSVANRYYNTAIDHVNYFIDVVGSDCVITDPHDAEKYVVDWTNTYRGGSVVCLPRTTKQVSLITSYCNKNKIGIVPQGGNTSLVGGAVGTTNAELILSMEKMNHIIAVDAETAVVTCESGCILENLNAEAEKHGLIVPLDLGSKASCMIGGNISTNAGGLRVVKYGGMHNCVLGLEVVKADGTVLNMLRSLYKDNSGYHLKNLFIGAEGTLGIITKVCIALKQKPNATAIILAKVSSFDKVPKLLQRCRNLLGDSLSAFEFMDSSSLSALRRDAPSILASVDNEVLPSDVEEVSKSGISGQVVVLIETSESDASIGQQRLDTFIERILSGDGEDVEYAVLSQNASQEKHLLQVRKNVPVSLMSLSRGNDPLGIASSLRNIKLIDQPTDSSPVTFRQHGKLFKYDISLSLRDTDIMLAELKERLAKTGFRLRDGQWQQYHLPNHDANEVGSLFSACCMEVCNFGHAADQNTHINVLTSTLVHSGDRTNQSCKGIEFASVGTNDNSFHPKVSISENSIKQYLNTVYENLNHHIFELITSKKGSISSEHGVGIQKRDAIIEFGARSDTEISVMRAIKRAFDPNGILNPGKVL